MGAGIQPNQLAADPLVLDEQAAAPTTGANKGAFYPKDVAGVTEGFYVDDTGQEVQITNNGNLNAEINDGANIGGGVPVFSGKNGLNLEFFSFVAGANITVTPVGDTLVLAATGVGEANTGSNEGTGVGTFIGKTATNLRFRSVLAGTNIDVAQIGEDIVITNTFVETGEANTASSPGATGIEITMPKVGVDLQFKKVFAGANMTVNDNGDYLELVSTASGTGEANSGTNIGGGAGEIFKQKAGTVLEFRRVLGEEGVEVTNNANEVALSVGMFTFTLPAGATLADRIASATGVPAGWTLEPGDTAGESDFGSSADTLVITHGLTSKLAQDITVLQETTSGLASTLGWSKADLSGADVQKTNLAQTKVAVVGLQALLDDTKQVRVFVKLI